MNLTLNGAYRNDNNLVRIHSPELAEDYDEPERLERCNYNDERDFCDVRAALHRKIWLVVFAVQLTNGIFVSRINRLTMVPKFDILVMSMAGS